MKPRPPPLYRLSRVLQRATAIVIVGIIIFVALAGYSLFQLKPSDVSGVDSVSPSLGNGTASLGMKIQITNSGYLPVNSVAIDVRAALANGGPIGKASVPGISIAPGGVGRLPFVINVTLNPNSPAGILLFHDRGLSLYFAVNVTYAYAFTASVEVNGSFSWGAPFYAWNATAGSVTTNPNGTASVPLTVSFTNHARYTLTGSIAGTVRTASGQECGTISYPLGVAGGSSYVQTETLTGSASCLSGASEVAFVYYVSPSVTIALPPEPIS